MTQKIAVLASIGVQTDLDSILQHYSLVPDNFDFEGAACIDVTNFDIIDMFLREERVDYILAREMLKGFYLPQWDSLSTPLQKALVSLYIYPATFTQSEIDALFSLAKQKLNWKTMRRKHKEARGKRWEALTDIISFILLLADAGLMAIDTLPFESTYVKFNMPHFSYWIQDAVYAPLGIDYTTTGLGSKSYCTPEIKQICKDIIIDGKY